MSSITHKQKKCKGSTSETIGFGCGEMNWKRTYGLGHECKCYPTWLYTSPKGIEKVLKATKKATASRVGLETALEESKTATAVKKLLLNAKMHVHKYVRERDKGLPCISCGVQWNSKFQAGHYFKAELYSVVKFNYFNINGQCEKCNIYEDGNFAGYELRIGFRIGELEHKQIKEKAMSRDIMKWNREELLIIIQNAKEDYKKLV
jgi:hypothetical protein